MTNAIRAAIVCGLIAFAGLWSSAPASAAIEFTPRPYAFSGQNTGSVWITLPWGVSVGCWDMTVAGNTINTTSDRLRLAPTFSSCTAVIGGIPLGAAVTATQNWELDYVSGSAMTGVYTTVSTPFWLAPQLVITIPALGCNVDISGLWSSSYVLLENQFWGVGLDVRVLLTTYVATDVTGTCPGVDSSGYLTVDGSLEVPDLVFLDA